MKHFNWDQNKNTLLKETRNISFEDVIFHIQRGEILDITGSHNPEKYPDQKLFILQINEYVYYVPFIEDEKQIFLKTIIPSRKLTAKYKEDSDNE